MKPDSDHRLKITKHAYDRASEFQLSVKKLVWLFWNAIESEKPPGRQKYNQSGVKYYRNGPHIFTVKVTKDRQKRDIYLLLTLYDQRLDLPISKLDF